MRVLWVNPSFLDYRIPVYRELNELLDGGLTVVYSKTRTPERVINKVEQTLGANAIGLTGERKFEFGRRHETWANSFIRIPYQRGLWRTLRSVPADVILAEGFFQWTPAAMLKSKLQNIPIAVVYERTRHTERNCPRWRVAYRKFLIPWLDAMLCTGTECANYSQSLGMPAERIACGHMSADSQAMRQKVQSLTHDQREQIRATWNVQGTAFIFAGRLIELKGVRELLKAWTRFEHSHSGLGTLLIAGDGPLRAELETTVRDNNLRSVRLLGHVDYEEIPSFYAAADVFVLPTLEDNWALVVPEAMACGLPILCSRYSGSCCDLVKEGMNGWAFDPCDEKSFYERLSLCVQDQVRLREMGRMSAQIIENHGPAQAATSILEGCKISIKHHLEKKFYRKAGEMIG